MALRLSLITKSSTNAPLADTAWARTPAPPGTRSLSRISGTSFCSARTKAGFAEGAVKFAETGLPILSRHRPEAPKRSGFPKISEIDLGVTIALAGERENCVGSGFDSAFRHPGEVNSQKRESWVWHWVNQIANQKLSFGRDLIILAAKRNDSVFVAVSKQRHEFSSS